MDFSLAPPPRIREVWGEFVDKLKLDSWQTWVHTVGDHAMVAIAGSWLARGSFAATSFKLRPGVSHVALFLTPFTVAVAEPGVIHVLADLAFYKGWDAYKAYEDVNRRYREWLARLDETELRNAVGEAAYAQLTRNGTSNLLNAILVIPPAWLTDP